MYLMNSLFLEDGEGRFIIVLLTALSMPCLLCPSVHVPPPASGGSSSNVPVFICRLAGGFPELEEYATFISLKLPVNCQPLAIFCSPHP